MKIIPKSKWPNILKHPKVKGICVGGCVWGDNPFVQDGDGFLPIAHAHSKNIELNKGWLCFRNQQILNIRYVQIHELAHLLVNDRHDSIWQKKVLELGGTLKKRAFQISYEPKKRH